MAESTPAEIVRIPAGTLVHVGGFPFRLCRGVAAEGREELLKLGLETGVGTDPDVHYARKGEATR